MKIPSPVLPLALLLAAAAPSPAAADPVRGFPSFSDMKKCNDNGINPKHCAATEISDGEEHCVYCRSESMMQSYCTTPEASQIASHFVSDLDCGGEDAISALGDPFTDLVTCAQATGSPDQCSSTELEGGESCVYCHSGMVQQDICTTPEASAMAKQYIPGLDCGGGEEEDAAVEDPFTDLVTCAQATGSPDQCSSTPLSAGGNCVYCHSDMVQQDICTTPEASAMAKQYIPDLDCGGGAIGISSLRKKVESYLRKSVH
jgi:hypothetical protein